MQFNSYIFILLYLPVFVIGYFILNKINLVMGKIFLVFMSALFYIYGGLYITIITGVGILINYFFAYMIGRNRKYKELLLLTDIGVNILCLFYFKYFNFFLGTLNSSFRTKFVLRDIILPLGISFLTFQQIMYVVSVYKESIVSVELMDYLAYILYFPKIIMGPLAEPTDLISQINDPALRRVNWDHIAGGIKTFSYGLFKKVILADTFAAAVSWGYSNMEAATAADWFLVMLCYTFEIYFDFSGYSDMAVAVSKMINITLPMNFDSPYIAVSIRDFWKRWHISLTNFLTEYIYIPLGGSKKGKSKTYFNTMTVFLVSGIWHGANWTFLLWGILHGILSVADRVFEKNKRYIPGIIKWAVTFTAVNFLWLLFRSDSVMQWCDILIRMFSFQNMHVSDDLLEAFLLPEIDVFFRILHMRDINTTVRGLNLLAFVFVSFFICLVPENNYKSMEKTGWLSMVCAAAVFIWAFLCLSSESVFVYFNF